MEDGRGVEDVDVCAGDMGSPVGRQPAETEHQERNPRKIGIAYGQIIEIVRPFPFKQFTITTPLGNRPRSQVIRIGLINVAIVILKRNLNACNSILKRLRN